MSGKNCDSVLVANKNGVLRVEWATQGRHLATKGFCCGTATFGRPMTLSDRETLYNRFSTHMKRFLIVEDQASDLRVATEVVEGMGFDDVQARTTAAEGRHYLDAAIEGTKPMPDVMLLDLDLGYESGYELLRFWYKNPDLAQLRMVVWTVLGKEEREMCRLFGVSDFVPKWEGAAGLKKVLGALAAGASGS